jgi:hypothetical protein
MTETQSNQKGLVALQIAMAQQALRLRRGGANYEQIGSTLEVTDTEARDLVLQALDNKILDTVGQSQKLNLERLETLLLKVWGQAQQGHHGAIDRVLRILDRIDKLRAAQEEKAPAQPANSPFPASAATPGQAESRSAYARFMDQLDDSPLAAEYLRLRVEGWTWRKALYIAWSVLPTDLRQPATLKELATQVLGLKSTSSIRKWREKDPEIEAQIETSALRVLRDDLPDILHAWKQSAKMLGSGGHRDRITYLKHMGIYQDEKTVVQAGDPERPMRKSSDFSDKDGDELDQIIDNLQATT